MKYTAIGSNQNFPTQTIFDVFVSMLRFEEIHDQLIYANSYTKTWNCSGMSFAYSMTYNKSLFQKLYQHNYYVMVAYPMIEVLYTTEEAR